MTATAIAPFPTFESLGVPFFVVETEEGGTLVDESNYDDWIEDGFFAPKWEGTSDDIVRKIIGGLLGERLSETVEEANLETESICLFFTTPESLPGAGIKRIENPHYALKRDTPTFADLAIPCFYFSAEREDELNYFSFKVDSDETLDVIKKIFSITYGPFALPDFLNEVKENSESLDHSSEVLLVNFKADTDVTFVTLEIDHPLIVNAMKKSDSVKRNQPKGFA